MRKIRLWCWILGLAAWAGLSHAKVMQVSLDGLHEDAKQRQATVIITKVVERFHYRKLPLDDQMSSSILDRYLESLDPNRSFFCAMDVADFETYRSRLDDALRRGDIEPAFKIFRRFRSRVEEQVNTALTLLEKNDFDFSRNESYRFDREDASWADDNAALNDLWRRRVKNDILGLRLAGKPEEQIQETLRKRYEGTLRRVRQFDADDVFQFFINAYTLSIEPHTSYMSPRGSENFDISMRLSLQGIGAVLSSENEYTVIQRTMPGGPAATSGELHSDDRIVGVAQGDKGEMVDVVGWRLQDVVDRIRGPKGSVVRLSVLPKSAGADGPSREITLVRDKIKLEDQASSGEILDQRIGGMKIGVIKVPTFYRDFAAEAAGEKDFRSTTRDVHDLLDNFNQQAVDGVVIDLRQNGGGSLTEATELTGLFIDKGPVVQVKDADGLVEVEQDEDPAQVYKGPLVVLVDRNSASASEIFAGAIQDYRRGLIVGEPTFGKGTVQALIDLGRFVREESDLGRLRLTMAQFFRVNGGSTQHRGVMPDIVFPTAGGAADYGERLLKNAIPWASIKPVSHSLNGVGTVAGLRDKHASRVTGNPGFRFLIEQEEELLKAREQKTVTLLETERRAQWKGREQQRLASLNRFRESQGLAAADSLEVEDEGDDDLLKQVDKVMLDEAAFILTDYIKQSRPRTVQLP